MKRALCIATAVCALAGAGFAVASLTALKTVNIKSTGFSPKTVTIAGGDTVRWKNLDTVRHQVVANNGGFASGQIPPQGTYSKRLDVPGTYPYHDALHPTLKGTVKVTGNPPSISIASTAGIVTYGNQIHVGGMISPAAVGDTVSVFAQPFGQLSFVKLADVQTTTGGMWDFVPPAPTILTSYKAEWKGKTSAIITVSVAPRLTLMRSGRWFVTHAVAARSFSRRWVYAQRLNRFGEWVSLRKVSLNRQSAQRFRLRGLPGGRNRIRVFMTTNQAGAGYVLSASPTLSFRRR
jgi:plastocyanin